MDKVLQGIVNAYAYVDYILITSTTEDDHYPHIKAVFKRLHEYGE